MNERIQELKKQASSYASTKSKEAEEWRWIYEEKFAELIAHDEFARGVIAERNRIINLFMIMHESAKGSHNYWHVATNLIQADVASNT